MAFNFDNLQCTLCLEPFKNPKLLPCVHTFCENCLKTLISKRTRQNEFPCPHCRKTIKVPAGGAAAFPRNIYIDAGKKEFMCSSHSTNETVSFCVSCEEAICVECMIEKHKVHDVKTFAAMVDFSKAQLKEETTRLQDISDGMEKLKQRAELKRSKVKMCVDQVTSEIHTRHSNLVSLADKHRDQQLENLKALAKSLDDSEEYASTLEILEKERCRLSNDQHQLQQVVRDGEHRQVVVLARDRRAPWRHLGVTEAVFPLSWQQAEFEVPCLETDQTGQDKATLNSSGAAVLSAIGVVGRKAMQHHIDFSICQLVYCGSGSVYFFAILDSTCLSVSYDDNEAPVQQIDSHGRLLESVTGITGRVTMQRLASGGCLFIRTEPSGKLVLLAKSNRPFLLEHHPPNQGIVKRISVQGSKAFHTVWEPMLALRCSRSLAFDADSSGTRFALLEKNPDRDTCMVSIYRDTSPEPAHWFTLRVCPRADICFHVTSEGKNVLLIADEAHNRLLAFSPELCRLAVVDRISLARPVAVNTDEYGRVWIGCRDGRIFVCNDLVLN